MLTASVQRYQATDYRLDHMTGEVRSALLLLRLLLLLLCMSAAIEDTGHLRCFNQSRGTCHCCICLLVMACALMG